MGMSTTRMGAKIRAFGGSMTSEFAKVRDQSRGIAFKESSLGICPIMESIAVP